MLTTTELEIVKELAKRPMRRYVAHIYHYDYLKYRSEPIKWTTEITVETKGNPYDEVDKYISENDEVFGNLLQLEVDVYDLDGKKEYVKRL